MSLKSEKYFCGILPDDDNIDFWSQHFNELVYRLASEGKVPQRYADKFFATQAGFSTEVLEKSNKFKSQIENIPLMH